MAAAVVCLAAVVQAAVATGKVGAWAQATVDLAAGTSCGWPLRRPRR